MKPFQYPKISKELLELEIKYFNYLDCKVFMISFEVLKSAIFEGIDAFYSLPQSKVLVKFSRESLNEENYK